MPFASHAGCHYSVQTLRTKLLRISSLEIARDAGGDPMSAAGADIGTPVPIL